MPNFYMQVAYHQGMDRAVADYISGMSDEFATRLFEELFCAAKSGRCYKIGSMLEHCRPPRRGAHCAPATIYTRKEARSPIDPTGIHTGSGCTQ